MVQSMREFAKMDAEFKCVQQNVCSMCIEGVVKEEKMSA